VCMLECDAAPATGEDDGVEIVKSGSGLVEWAGSDA
jgi:hypothetical protein